MHVLFPPLVLFNPPKYFFFYSIVDDGQKVMLIRFVTAVWIAPILYDIIGRQNVYPSSNQPFLSPRSVVYIDTPIKLRICLGAIIHAD
jgi:hypothetical protein